MQTALDKHIEIDPKVRGGRPCTAGTRVSVDDIAILHMRMGLGVEEIVGQYALEPQAIYAALTYYFDHKSEIDRQIDVDDAYLEAFKRDNLSPLREKLRALAVAEKIRFHLDENMPRAVAITLRRYGLDITTPNQTGLRTRDDDAHLAFMRAQGRVIVTDDADFLRTAGTTSDHPGIVYCRRSAHSIGEMVRFLMLIHDVLDPNDMHGWVEYL